MLDEVQDKENSDDNIDHSNTNDLQEFISKEKTALKDLKKKIDEDKNDLKKDKKKMEDLKYNDPSAYR